ncbi:contractile injection system tape measure protein [Pinibacter aurantiacus]|uniref:Uncharacterized protein n=1 Tax=Pinibacter aurantiacus TaxID=2851599 RepID=A0A9E2SCN2_9BACT|nr:contractile injection system tape measure protein [Pinibacter aurantiacus]MBV4360546.1 hypothetical protein [Pinibacter aurantiacus]
MIEHTINREIFDFHYGSEKVAERMQRQLVNYYAYEFNQIIQRAIEQQFASSEFYFCDRIEIDLGDIEEDAFEEREVFEKFEDVLTQKLRQIKNSPSPQVSYEKIAEEVVKQFLLEGDVPWWINKNDVIAIQPLVRLLVNRAPEKLMAIIKHNRDTALVRLATLFNESSNSDVIAFKSFLEALRKEGLSIDQPSLVPVTADDLHSRRYDRARLVQGNRITLQLHESEPDVLQKLEKILSKGVHSVSSTDKDAIIAAIVKRKRLLSAIKEMTLFTNQETIKAMTWLLQKQRLSASAEKKLTMHLSTFSVYALHWLAAETLRMQSPTSVRRDEENTTPGTSSDLSSKIIESEELKEAAQQTSNNENENDETDILKQEALKEQAAEQKLSQKQGASSTNFYSRAASINYLLEKLRLKHASSTIFDNYSDSAIQELASSFNKIEQDVAGKKMLAAFLLEHPYFFKFNFLEIITEGFAIPAPEDQRNESLRRTTERANITETLFSELKTLRRKTEAILQKLSENELLILQDVLQKKSLATKREHQTMQKVLQLMPVKLLVLLQAFTMLSESSIASTIVVQSAAKDQTIDIVDEHLPVDHFQHSGQPRKIQINNAGICLVAAYLPSFFKNMHLLEDKKFKSISHAMQAMYLIAYLAEGATKHKEYLLQFNKILTGFAVTDPVAHMPRLPSGYKKEADALLTAIIENWKALRNTSINGFRQSFLQRNGLLTDNGDSWTLQVERKGHDVLIDSVPWSFSMIRFPWMRKPVVVEW